MNSKNALEKLLTYQTRLQGVANELAQKLKKILDAADAETLALLKSDYKYVDGDLKKTIISVRKLVDAIKKQRSKSFDSALDLTIETGREVAGTASLETIKETLGLFDSDELAEANARELEKKWIQDARKAELEERRKRIKPLSEEKIDDVLQYSPIQGEAISEWFSHWETNDLKRISDAIQTGAVEGLSVAEIVKKIRGTKENDYKDGIVETTKTSATTVARTLINGVSNAARMETLQENADVLDGIQFLATLDAKTSFICANLDGRIWRGDEMKSAPRPPLHPNCRSTLVPYIELRDADGKLIDEGADLKDADGNVVVNALTRPAANADFDKLAEEAYNKNAREKGWDRRYSDLSASTRLKFYYQAQRDWQAANGENAYRQVPSTTNFQEYFEKQTPEFQESWLGAERFSAYNTGQLTLDRLVRPDSNYVVPVKELNVYVEHSGANFNRNKNASDLLIDVRNAMKKEEDEWVFPLLEKQGRTLGPNAPRENNIVVEKKAFDRGKMFSGKPFSSVEIVDGEKCLYRLYYDKDGILEYSDDFSHNGEKTHDWPHRHVFFNKARSWPIFPKEFKR